MQTLGAISLAKRKARASLGVDPNCGAGGSAGPRRGMSPPGSPFKGGNTLSGTIANTPGITANLPRKIENGDDSAKLRVEDIAQWAQRGLPAAAMHLVVIGSVEVEGTSSPLEGAEVWHLRTKPSAFGPATYERSSKAATR